RECVKRERVQEMRVGEGEAEVTAGRGQPSGQTQRREPLPGRGAGPGAKEEKAGLRPPSDHKADAPDLLAVRAGEGYRPPGEAKNVEAEEGPAAKTRGPGSTDGLSVRHSFSPECNRCIHQG